MWLFIQDSCRDDRVADRIVFYLASTRLTLILALYLRIDIYHSDVFFYKIIDSNYTCTHSKIAQIQQTISRFFVIGNDF